MKKLQESARLIRLWLHVNEGPGLINKEEKIKLSFEGKKGTKFSNI